MNEEFLQFFMGTNSLYEGFGDVKSVVAEAKEKKLKSLVISDVATTTAYVKFYKACKANDIKPLLGLTTAVKFEESDILFFLEKNESKLKDIFSNVLGKSFELSKFYESDYNELSTIHNGLTEIKKAAATFTKSKSKKRLEILNDKLKEISIVGGHQFIDEDSAKLLTEKIAKLDVFLEKGLLRLVSNNHKGVVEINEILTNAFNEGQSEGDIRLEKKGEKIKRVDYQYPLASIEKMSQRSNIQIVSLTDFDDVIFRHTDLTIQKRVAKLLKERLRSLKIGITEFKAEEKEINLRKKYNIENAINISNMHNIPVFSTHLARFVRPNDYEIFDLKSASLTEKLYSSPVRLKKGFKDQHLVSYDEFKERFSKYPVQLVKNSTELASDLQSEMIIDKNYLPKSPIPEDYAKNVLREEFLKNGMHYDDSLSLDRLEDYYHNQRIDDMPEDLTSLEKELEIKKEFSNIISKPYLTEKAWDGVLSLLKRNNPNDWESKVDEYKERFDLEINIICDMGFAGYFLIVHDFIAEAKKRGIPVGPGRGSGAGSLIAFGLDITIPDPIEFDLVFERFLNPERVSMPDFDIDFCTNNRAEVIDYVMEKFGRDAVAYIATEGKFKPKSAFKNILKSYGFTVKQGDHVSSVISDDPSLKTSELLEDDEFNYFLDERPAMKFISERVSQIANETSQMGVHAGGVVISPTKLTDFSAVTKNPDGSGVSTIYDKDDVETAGLVKFDFLGLSTLTVINNAVMQVKENYDVDIDIDRITLNDKTTYDLLKTAKTQEIFQLSSSGMKDLVSKLQVENIEDISALVALYRPGPMQSGMLDSYVKRKRGEEPVTYVHPKAEEITKNTFGTIIYQEQVMKIAQEIAGYSLGGADLLRRAMGKKKPEEMKKQKTIFLSGSLKQNQGSRERELKESLNGFEVELDLRGFHFLEDYIDEDGHFSEQEKFKSFLVDFVGLNDTEYEQLEYEIKNDKLNFNELLNDKKKLIYPRLAKKVGDNLGENNTPNAKELSTNIYFSLFETIKYSNIFEVIEKFAGYGFNKSHSLAYAFVSYQTAYLKSNYPKEFFAAVLTNQDELEKLSPIVYDMEHNFNIKLEPPCVNKSHYEYKASKENNSVRFGLVNIKSLGKYGKLIEKERLANGEYKDLQDLMLRVNYRNIKEPETSNSKLSSGAMKGLLYSGALDTFIGNKGKEMGMSEMDKMRNREILLKEFEFFSDASVYPAKEDIVELVESRMENGHYSGKILELGGEFGLHQGLLIKKIGYAKTFESIIPESFSKSIGENKEFFVLSSPTEFIKTSFGSISEYEFEEFVRLTEEPPENITKEQSKIIDRLITVLMKDFTELKFLGGDTHKKKEFIKLAKKSIYGLTKKQKGVYKELAEDLMDSFTHSERDKIEEMGKIVFNDDFGKKDGVQLLEAMVYSEKLLKSKKSELLSLNLYEVKGMYDSKYKDYFEKSKRTIQALKKYNPELIKAINYELKKSVQIEDQEYLNKEKEYTGGYITMHPVRLNNAIEKTNINYSPVIDIAQLDKITESPDLFEQNKDRVCYVAASINNIQLKKTKNGADMAIVTLSDETGDRECIMFSNLFEEIKDYLKDGVVGSIGIKIDEYQDRPSIQVKEIKLHSPDISIPFGNENIKPQYNKPVRN